MHIDILVSVEDLDCFDLLIWLRSGVAASQRLGLSQSKISRSARRVADAFMVFLVKRNNLWVVLGDTGLLNMERQVHQNHRWITGRPLRLEAHFLSSQVCLDCSVMDWVIGNLDSLEVRVPLELLRNAVIDAWIGFYPDVPGDDDRDLCCIHLARLPVHVEVTEKHPLALLGSGVTLDDVRRYSPLSLASRCNNDPWNAQATNPSVISYATSSAIDSLDQSRVILPLQEPLEGGVTLVVRHEYAIDPRAASHGVV